VVKILQSAATCETVTVRLHFLPIRGMWKNPGAAQDRVVRLKVVKIIRSAAPRASEPEAIAKLRCRVWRGQERTTP
jgi:hypothetical protein